MSDDRDVAYAVGFFGLGIWLFFKGFMSLRRKRLIENTPTSTIRGLAMGLVELTGKAKKTNLFKSPFTETDCVFYRYTVERYERSGRSGRWVVIAKGDSIYSPFCLDDGTGTIMVFPQNAELMMPIDYAFNTGFGKVFPANLIGFMEKNGLGYQGFWGNYNLRFKEWYIKPDETVFVLGMAGKISDRLNDCKENLSSDVVIEKGEGGQVFIISDESQTQITKNLSWQSLGGILGGAVLSLAMLAYLLFRFDAWKNF